MYSGRLKGLGRWILFWGTVLMLSCFGLGWVGRGLFDRWLG